MGNSEDGRSCKPEKSSSPAPNQSTTHVYPDWAAMQAYYGSGVAVHPYFNSAVANGHTPPPYMWGPPQTMMPPYGGPYAAFYAHGGAYAPPGVPIDAAPLSLDTPAKSPGNTDRGLISKLQGFDGLTMSIGNGSSDNGEDGTDRGLSQSGETEGLSDGSDIDTAGVGDKRKRRSCESTPNNSGDGKSQTRNCPPFTGEVNGASKKAIGVVLRPSNVTEKMMGTVLTPKALELKNPAIAHVKANITTVSQPSHGVPNETLLQNDPEQKREKRKQSNRESARRSRLRKQEEAEELAKRVQSLTAENSTLKAEIYKLTEDSEKLKLENAALMERLKNEQVQTKAIGSGKIDDKRLQPVSTAILLGRVNSSGSSGEVYEKNKSGAKLRQLLDASPRTDAVAAG